MSIADVMYEPTELERLMMESGFNRIGKLETELAASQSRVERLEACIRNGMKVYNGNGHPQRAEAEMWNAEARLALTNDAGEGA